MGKRTSLKPRKLILTSHLSPGDAVMLTAAVRDLHKAHPFKFITDVDTTAPDIWKHNPYITKLRWKRETHKGNHIIIPQDEDADAEVIECHYPLVNGIKYKPYHFIHGYAQYLERKLRVKIPITSFKGDIHISKEEKGWISQVQEEPHGLNRNFWIIMAGGKYDFTCKWWDPQRYQAVVDHFLGKIKFVQCGEAHHWHSPLRNVINLIGKTNTRQFIRLVYHSVGILCPVTFAMHLAAAVPTKQGHPENRACVVVAGGREPSQWEAYPTHQFIHNCGALPCCQEGGCWKSRCQPVNDGDEKDNDLCSRPISIGNKIVIPECMSMIRADDVARRIETYYDCGAGLRYFE